MHSFDETTARTRRQVAYALFGLVTFASVGLASAASMLAPEPDAETMSRGALRRQPHPPMSLSGLRGAVAPERGKRRREVLRAA